MTKLILGLVLFLGVHSVRIVADGWRNRMVARLGAGPWRGGVSLVSVAGLALIVLGYAQAREAPVALWSSPLWARHAAGALMLVAMVLLVAAHVPRNAIRARLRHPMVLGVKVWALAHLMANHTLADLLLFGSFLVWAVCAFRSARQRDRAAAAAGTAPALPAPTMGGTVLAVVAGLAAWALFAFQAHAWLFGVRPFGA